MSRQLFDTVFSVQLSAVEFHEPAVELGTYYIMHCV